jgi:uncharacterized damage-inducible protein DinB
MMYSSVAEIYDTIGHTRQRLDERVRDLTNAQENFRPASESWSIAQIVEHLSIFEDRMTRLFSMMIKKTESADAADTNGQGFRPFSLDQHVERSLKEKYTAPETVSPSGSVRVADSLDKLRHARASLMELQPRIEALDLSATSYPHPAFGPLNLYQWLALIGVHEERHLRQIEALMASPGYQAQ